MWTLRLMPGRWKALLGMAAISGVCGLAFAAAIAHQLSEEPIKATVLQVTAPADADCAHDSHDARLLLSTTQRPARMYCTSATLHEGESIDVLAGPGGSVAIADEVVDQFGLPALLLGVGVLFAFVGLWGRHTERAGRLDQPGPLRSKRD